MDESARTVSYSFDLSRLSPALNRTWSDMLHSQRASLEGMWRGQQALKGEIKALERRNVELVGEIEALERELQVAQEEPRAAAPPHEPPPSGSEVFRLERLISAHSSPVHGVAMDPGASAIATASWDATVKMVDLSTGEVVRTLGDPGEDGTGGPSLSGLYSVAFSKTQEGVLGCTSADAHVYIWNYKTGTLQSDLRGHTNEVNGIDFHPQQPVCATASDDCGCRIWDLVQPACLRVLEHEQRPVYGCTFMGAENEYLVATCSFDCHTRIFDIRSREVVAKLQTHTDDITGIDYAPGANLIANGSDDGKISIVDVRQQRLAMLIDTKRVQSDNEVKRVAFSPDGSWLAAACSSGMVLVYDVSASPARQVAALGGHLDCVFDVAWGVAPSGARVLASASHDFACGLWKQVL